ncbi:MAG TPA: fasciclin domain-containing protein [Ilumatobacteraceae bacterium]|nr:fasciclin domain-containing protein [Ilumatobacteraceae bacterium]
MATHNSSRRRHRSLAVPMLAAATLLAVSACGSDETADDQLLDVDAEQVDDVVDSAVSDVDETGDELAQTLRDNGLDSIAGVVEQVDVSEWLGEGDFTFFAPNNEAFLGLEAEETADLLTDPAQILDVLKNHTLADTVTADELTTMQTVETEADSTLEVTTDGDEVRLGDVVVVSTDIEVGSGVIHVVDGLLLP